MTPHRTLLPDAYAVVITTVNAPTRGVQEIARDAPRLGAEFVLVGDEKSPANFHQPGATYLDVQAQRDTGFAYAEVAPTRHYARKNIGYLHAIRNGATVLIETDDDNIPLDAFWAPRARQVEARVVRGTDWTNVYAWYADGVIWPRGLPLDRVRTAPTPASLDDLRLEWADCPIQQGLADDNPDVDAIYRLVLPLPLQFRQADPVVLLGPWCPFNSQNTTWWADAFPLLYLPYFCSFRMTDIWRSFVAQRIAYLNGWGVLFHTSTVFQERNEHDLLLDFEQEIPGYLHNARIREALNGLDLPAGADAIGRAVSMCYQRLIEMGLVGDAELPLLEAWLKDVGAG